MSLITKYRPRTFDEVVGQTSAVRAVQSALERQTTRAFLLNGPAGTGKTTLARIIAHEFGADEMGINEIDGATHTGIDAMRKVAEGSQYRALDASGKKCYIVDECHMLSRATWNSLLKIVEEPPEHVMWIFCTTDPSKVPNTIRTRCHEVALNPVGDHVLEMLLTEIAEKEGLEASEEMIEVAAEEADGSPRRAIVNLGKVAGLSDKKEAVRLLHRIDEGTAEEIDVARALYSRKFVDVRKYLGDLRNSNPESLRIVIFRYATGCFFRARDDAERAFAGRVLSTFEQPCLDQNGMGDLVLRVLRFEQILRQSKGA